MSEENVEIVRRGYEHYDRTGEADSSTLDPEDVYGVSRRTFEPRVITATREYGRSSWVLELAGLKPAALRGLRVE